MTAELFFRTALSRTYQPEERLFSFEMPKLSEIETARVLKHNPSAAFGMLGYGVAREFATATLFYGFARAGSYHAGSNGVGVKVDDTDRWEEDLLSTLPNLLDPLLSELEEHQGLVLITEELIASRKQDVLCASAILTEYLSEQGFVVNTYRGEMALMSRS